MKYGYARVSTEDQNAAMQHTALTRAGCKTLFIDELSGAITKRDLIAMLDGLRDRGVKFRSLTEAIDTTTPTGRAMWQMIGVLAELERSLIVERTQAGMTEARRRGVKFGRRRN